MHTQTKGRTVSVTTVAVLILGAVSLQSRRPPDLSPLPLQLDSSDPDIREDAAKSLATTYNPGLAEAIRRRIDAEPNFHVQLALHYALAAQGDRQALQFLIDSLQQTGHMGANYLGRVAPVNYRWNYKRWRTWYEDTTDDEFRDFTRRRWARRPIVEEWREFAGAYGRREFAAYDHREQDERFKSHFEFTAQDQEMLTELPTARAWTLYERALEALQHDGDRAQAARLFHQLVIRYPRTIYTDEARELAYLLDRMVMEDRNYIRPKDESQLTASERIKHLIFDLRDVEAYQISQPGRCHILPFSFGDNRAAAALQDIRLSAAPDLIALLDDRRPIGGVGYWRDFHPTRTVLRYQDVAIEILESVLATDAYQRRRTTDYFSNEPAEVRDACKKALRDKYRQMKEASFPRSQAPAWARPHREALLHNG